MPKRAEDKLEQLKKRINELQKSNEELRQEIKEYKRIGITLKENEEKFRLIFDKADDMIALAELKENGMPGKYIEVNEVGLKRLGYTRDEFLNMTPEMITIPEELDKMGKTALKLSNKGHASALKIHVTKEGKRIPVEVNTHLFKLNGKKVALGISRDITERKQMENDLKESEEKFRGLFNKANDMISLSEIKENGMPGKYIEVNEVGIKRLGYSREELLNMGPTDIIAPDKRVEMPKNASIIAKNDCSSFEIVHVTKERKKIPVEVNGHIINYKGMKAYLTVSRDITKRKQMEEALKESEEKFREIFNKANDMITLHEMKENGLPGKFIEVNEVGCKRLGYTAEEFMNMAPVDIVAPDKRPEMANNAVEIWTKGYAKFEIIHVTKDLKRIPVEVNTHLFKLNGKKVALGISRDITERKKSEKELNELLEKLSRSNEKLEQMLM